LSIEDLIEKGLIKTCDKHGSELVYFDASQDCPVCKVVIQEKPLNKKKIAQSKQPVPEPIKPKKVEEPQGIMDRIRAWSLRKKVVMAIVIVVILWVFLNYKAIFSYFGG